MWMKHNVRIVIFILAAVLISSENYAISFSGISQINGIVKDSVSGEGLPYASIRILLLNDS